MRARLQPACENPAAKTMPCPFFKPTHQLDSGGWNPEPRLPLGGAWGGECHAVAGDPCEPPETAQRELCNCGYARGLCQRFPENAPVDAVRFSMTADGRLIYILEKDHAPLKHGEMKHGEFDAADVPELLAIQAQAFRKSYRERYFLKASAQSL
jgi:hypothetical protein